MRQTLLLALCLGIVSAGIPARAEQPVDAPVAEPNADVDTHLPMGPILLGSFGAVAVLVGAGFGWQAKGEYDRFNERDPNAKYDTQLVYPRATQSQADDIRNHVIVADVLMFGGAVAVGASLLWGLLGRKKAAGMKAEVKAASLTPSIAPNRLGLVVEF